jgi:hypothetical protein
VSKDVRAFLIYECAQGWCIEPAEVSNVRKYPEQTRAYSRLTQLLWDLGRRSRKWSSSSTGAEHGISNAKVEGSNPS